jgi:hypothetical protein
MTTSLYKIRQQVGAVVRVALQERLVEAVAGSLIQIKAQALAHYLHTPNLPYLLSKRRSLY